MSKGYKLAEENLKLKKKLESYQNVIGPQRFIDDSVLRGGYRIVKTLEERDLIPCCNRKEGMLVYVTDEKKEYKLFELTCKNDRWVNNTRDTIGGDKNYVHDQTTPSKEWDIFHNLNKKPSVTVTDSANTVVEGKVVINDGVRILIEFNAPFTGSAILN